MDRRTTILNEAIQAALLESPERALGLSEEILQKPDARQYECFLALCCRGSALRIQHRLVEAEIAFYCALKELPQDRQLECDFLGKLSSLYREFGKLDKAVSISRKQLRLSTQISKQQEAFAKIEHAMLIADPLYSRCDRREAWHLSTSGLAFLSPPQDAREKRYHRAALELSLICAATSSGLELEPYLSAYAVLPTEQGTLECAYRCWTLGIVARRLGDRSSSDLLTEGARQFLDLGAPLHYGLITIDRVITLLVEGDHSRAVTAAGDLFPILPHLDRTSECRDAILRLLGEQALSIAALTSVKRALEKGSRLSR